MACDPGVPQLCCDDDRIKLVAWQVYQGGFVPFNQGGAPIQKLYRRISDRSEDLDDNGNATGFVERVIEYPDPQFSMVQGGDCPISNTVTSGGTGGGFANFPLTLVKRSEDTLVFELPRDVRRTVRLGLPVTAEDIFARLDSINARVSQLIEQIAWVTIPSPAIIGAALVGELCGGQLSMPGAPLMTGLVGQHGIERAYMTVFRPSNPQQWLREDPNIFFAHWRGYEQKLYADVTQPYCLVRRAGIPFPHLHPREANLTGGTTGSCTRENGVGLIEVRAARCELNSNTATDFYTAVSRVSPPVCCGMAP